ncbi:hypothetical protein ACEPAH_2185 [Sanghuangporus vaninii]
MIPSRYRLVFPKLSRNNLVLRRELWTRERAGTDASPVCLDGRAEALYSGSSQQPPSYLEPTTPETADVILEIPGFSSSARKVHATAEFCASFVWTEYSVAFFGNAIVDIRSVPDRSV